MGNYMYFLYVSSDWDKVEEDCRRVVQLDRTSVKVRITLFYFLSLYLSCLHSYTLGMVFFLTFGASDCT